MTKTKFQSSRRPLCPSANPPSLENDPYRVRLCLVKCAVIQYTTPITLLALPPHPLGLLLLLLGFGHHDAFGLCFLVFPTASFPLSAFALLHFFFHVSSFNYFPIRFFVSISLYFTLFSLCILYPPSACFCDARLSHTSKPPPIRCASPLRQHGASSWSRCELDDAGFSQGYVFSSSSYHLDLLPLGQDGSWHICATLSVKLAVVAA